jgi:bifunctional DNA-binding transcriptional regulator/antitoxin component of YhaV-PrlF toxin-antitoxin module
MANTRYPMPLATLKEKGQITLPVDIRKAIHADKGDIFNFQVVGDQVVMTLQKVVPAQKTPTPRPRKGVDISKYIGIAKGAFGSVEEIDDYIRNERASWD